MSAPASTALLLDDRQEWLRFSRQHKTSPPDWAGAVWDSHVVIQGMHCSACAFTVEDALRRVPGVRFAEVNATTHRAKVVWAQGKVLPSQWMQAVVRAGYGVLPAADSSLRHQRQLETRLALWRWLVAGFCMMQVV